MSQYLLYFLAAYLVGSIPTGSIFARIKGEKSILVPNTRSIIRPGEIFEILGIPLGLLAMLVDIFKGFFAVSLLKNLIINPQTANGWWIISIGAALVVIGHCNSALLGFKGGRGLAPTFGSLLFIFPIPAIISGLLGFFLGFWGLSIKPGALSAAGLMPIASIIWVLSFHYEQLYFLYIVAFLSLWTMWEHKDELKSYMGIKDHSSAIKNENVEAEN